MQLHLLPQRTRTNLNEQRPVLPQPQTSFFLIFLVPPLLPLAGDVSKVQWPAALQKLHLQECTGTQGKFQPCFICVPNEHGQRPLVRSQPQN